jgi:DNA polymerase-1
MQRAYPDVTRWQDDVTHEGESGYVINDWGRKMVVDPDRAYTQAPALYGQSGTRELMVDALIRMLKFDMRIITWLKAQVHDELIFSIPILELSWAPTKIKELMDSTWQPSDGSGQAVEFPASAGKPAKTWMEATH